MNLIRQIDRIGEEMVVALEFVAGQLQTAPNSPHTADIAARLFFPSSSVLICLYRVYSRQCVRPLEMKYEILSSCGLMECFTEVWKTGEGNETVKQRSSKYERTTRKAITL